MLRTFGFCGESSSRLQVILQQVLVHLFFLSFIVMEYLVAKIRHLSLAEALESGRPIKRYMDFHWRENEEKMTLSQEDIRATDWEVKPEPKRFVLYVSPDGTKCTFDHSSPIDWERYMLIEEGKS
jgi:hypothetical protein